MSWTSATTAAAPSRRACRQAAQLHIGRCCLSARPLRLSDSPGALGEQCRSRMNVLYLHEFSFSLQVAKMWLDQGDIVLIADSDGVRYTSWPILCPAAYREDACCSTSMQTMWLRNQERASESSGVSPALANAPPPAGIRTRQAAGRWSPRRP